MGAVSFKYQSDQIRKKLAKNEHNADVDRIVRVSKRRLPMDREILFQLLAHAAVPGPPTYRKAIIRHQKLWESLAGQLEIAAKNAECLVSDPLSYIEGYVPSVLDSAQRRVPPRLFRWMRVYAKFARFQARSLGAFLRKLGQAEKWNAGVVNLLLSVRAATGKLCENELARLLTETCEIAGNTETFTADKLRKLWQRHVLPIAKSHERIGRYRQELAAEMADLRQKLLVDLDKSTP